jgi:hypothetical protein
LSNNILTDQLHPHRHLRQLFEYADQIIMLEDGKIAKPSREVWRNKILFLLAFLGAVFALFTAYNLGREKKSLPPVFTPATNPYAKGIYSNGIIESYQPSGANVNISEVAGTTLKSCNQG